MAEEKESLLKNVKAQITAGVAVVLTTLGTVFSEKVEEFFGVEGDDAGVEVVQENNQSVNVEGPTIVVNIPEQKKDTVVKKVYVKPVEKPKEKEEKSIGNLHKAKEREKNENNSNYFTNSNVFCTLVFSTRRTTKTNVGRCRNTRTKGSSNILNLDSRSNDFILGGMDYISLWHPIRRS